MASIVSIAKSNDNGARVLAAVSLIRDGFGILQEYDGLRANAIGVGDAAVTMRDVFGVLDATQAQALNDRWAEILTDFGDGTFVTLRDFIDAIVPQTP